MSGPKSVFDPKPPTTEVTAREARAKGQQNTIGKRGKFRLASAAAAAMSDEQVVWWLLEVANGRDPGAKRDENGEPIPPPSGFVKAPEWKDRIKAFDLFLQRRNGQAPQSVVVEEHIQVSGRIEHAALAPARVRAWDPTAKAELRAVLKRAVRGELAAGERETVPVEAVESVG